MKQLLTLLENQNLPLNRCYNNYEVYDNFILIRKSKELISSAIGTKEMLRLYEVFADLKNVEFLLLGNEDISIKLKEEDH
jgi:hypothetical protein